MGVGCHLRASVDSRRVHSGECAPAQASPSCAPHRPPLVRCRSRNDVPARSGVPTQTLAWSIGLLMSLRFILLSLRAFCLRLPILDRQLRPQMHSALGRRPRVVFHNNPWLGETSFCPCRIRPSWQRPADARSSPAAKAAAAAAAAPGDGGMQAGAAALPAAGAAPPGGPLLQPTSNASRLCAASPHHASRGPGIRNRMQSA